MLGAMANSAVGNNAAAANLASEAAKLRPYSVEMQMASAVIQSRAGTSPVDTAGGNGADVSAWSNIVKLSPNSANTLVSLNANSGNFAAVASLADIARIEWPEQKIAPYALLARNGPGAEFGKALIASTNIAYAKAVVGDVNAAQKHMAIVREKVTSLIISDGEETPLANKFPEKLFDQFLNVVDARIAVSEGRVEDARSLIADLAPQKTAAFAELNKAIGLAEAKNKDIDNIDQKYCIPNF